MLASSYGGLRVRGDFQENAENVLADLGGFARLDGGCGVGIWSRRSELGLAHAACKPVVLAAGQLEDVPFDLRHLRVIIYDVREPQWSDKLKRSVTDYLKNAKGDPDKSIPQTFRTLAQETA